MPSPTRYPYSRKYGTDRLNAARPALYEAERKVSRRENPHYFVRVGGKWVSETGSLTLTPSKMARWNSEAAARAEASRYPHSVVVKTTELAIHNALPWWRR